MLVYIFVCVHVCMHTYIYMNVSNVILGFNPMKREKEGKQTSI